MLARAVNSLCRVEAVPLSASFSAWSVLSKVAWVTSGELIASLSVLLLRVTASAPS